MKIIIPQRALEGAVRKAALFTPANSTLPQLEMLRVSANGKLEISATDLETSVIVTVTEQAGYTGVRDGVALLPARLLQQCLTATLEKYLAHPTTDNGVPIGTAKPRLVNSNSEITAEHDAITRRLALNVGNKLVAQFATNEHAELPNPYGAFVAAQPAFFLEAATLAAIAKKTAPFVGTDELRPAMMGIEFTFDVSSDGSGTLTATATDRHRLISLAIPALAAAPFTFIVPVPALQKAAQVLAGPVKIEWNATHVQLSGMTGDATPGAAQGTPIEGTKAVILSRVIDERYPDWRSHVPHNERRITVDRLKLRAALPALAPCLNRVARMELAITDNDGRLWLVAANGTAEARLHIEADDTANGMTSFHALLNARFLADALAALSGDWVTFEVSDDVPFAGIVLHETAEESNDAAPMNALLLIMPQRPNPGDDDTAVRDGRAYMQAEEDADDDGPAPVIPGVLYAKPEPYDSTLEQAQAFVGVERAFAEMMAKPH